MDKLREISEQIEYQMSQIEGTRQITSSLDDQDTQIALNVDKDKIRQYGLTGSDVANQVRNTVSGYTATTLKADGEEMDIIVVLPEERTSNLVNIEDMSITTGDGSIIPHSAIAEVSMEDVPSSINREDQSRYVTVSCEVYGRDSGSVGNDVQNMLSQISMPQGYTAKIGGSNETMNDTFSSIGLVIIWLLFLYTWLWRHSLSL